MKKRTFFILFILLFLSSFFFIIESLLYISRQRENKSLVQYCSQNSSNDCYTRMFELMLPKLLIYNAKAEGKDIDLIAFDPLTVRIDSNLAFEKSDLLFGYGVYHTVAYEEKYSEIYNKFSYAFDCGVPTFVPKSSKCLFYSECIASDDFLIFDHLNTKKMQVSSGKVHTLAQKLRELNFQDKKIFIKMDVDEADAVVIPEFIKNSDSITGLNISLHLLDPTAIIERIPLLEKLNEDFVLVARHTFVSPNNLSYRDVSSKYYRNIINSRIIYLSYINKNLLDDYSLSINQNTKSYYEQKGLFVKNSKLRDIPLSDIHYIVVLIEKLKEFAGMKEKK